MDILRQVLLVIHILGFAALLGGMFLQFRDETHRINSAMRDGVGTAFLAGLALVGVLEAGDEAVDHVKVAVKFAIGLVLLVLIMANVRKETIPKGLFYGLFALTIVNVVVAVMWGSVHVG